MIQILIREIKIEIAGSGERVIDRLPIASFQTHEKLLAYCKKKGFVKIGDGIESQFTRETNFDDLKIGIKKFYHLSVPFKITEKFIIFEQELK